MTSTPYGPFFAFAAAVTWALGSSNYAKLSQRYTPFQVNLSRATFALPLFFLAAFVTGGGYAGGIESFRALRTEHYGWFGLAAIASFGLGDSLFLWSTLSLGVPGALAIASGYPILTALYGFFFVGETMLPLQWLGLAIAIGGIAAVILTDPKPAEKSPHDGGSAPTSGALFRKPVGLLLAFVTAIAWATNAICIARGARTLDPAVANTVRLTIAIAIIVAIQVFIYRERPRVVDRETWRKYAWVFIVEAFFGSYFYMYGLSHSSLVSGSVLASLAPVLAVPVAIAMRLERFSAIRFAAVLAVVAGLALL